MNVSVNPQPCPASTPVIMCRTIKKPAGKTTCRAGQHVLEVLSSRIGFLPTENQDKILVQILGTLGGLSSNITSSLARQISHIVYRGNVLYLLLLLNHHMKIEGIHRRNLVLLQYTLPDFHKKGQWIKRYATLSKSK